MPAFSFPIQPDENRTRVYDLNNAAPLLAGETLSSVISSTCEKGGVTTLGILVSATIDSDGKSLKVRRVAGNEDDVHNITVLLETSGACRIEVDITSVTKTKYEAPFELQPTEITLRDIELANKTELYYLGETLFGNPSVTMTADDASSTTGMLKSTTHLGTRAKIRVGQPVDGKAYTIQSLSTTSGSHVIAANLRMLGVAL